MKISSGIWKQNRYENELKRTSENKSFIKTNYITVQWMSLKHSWILDSAEGRIRKPEVRSERKFQDSAQKDK